MDGLNKLPRGLRGKLCWLLGHQFRVIWFKSDNQNAQAGIADTEAGCIYCGKSKPNEYPLVETKIDYLATKHRKSAPKHNVLPF